jgi:hypothetical protein
VNPFVDTQKRSIELPFGCKELADVLGKTNREPDSKHRWKLLNGLQETERYLAGLLLKPETLSYLDINLTHTPHRLQLLPVRGQLCILLSVDGTDKGRLSRIRRFFRDAEISPVVDAIRSVSVVSETSSRILIYPLPVVAPDAAELITQVIREGFGIADDAPLYITSNEQSVT